MTTIAITGGAGFIGHHFIEHVLKKTDWNIHVLDRLTYASSGFDRLRDIQAFDDKRVRCFTADITQPFGVGLRRELGEPEYIVHMAAETHVDNSITDPWPFVQANVVGTFRVLEWARTLKNLKRLVHFSTDEVFGPAPDGVQYKEWDRHSPNNPYAATKSASDQMCLAWENTYKVPVFTTTTMNVIGERQHPEKWVPLIVRKTLRGEKITVHASPDLKRSGSRFYIHARNVASALLFLLDRGQPKERYNIVGECEVSNLDMVLHIAKLLGKPALYEMSDWHSDRPGHDLRYALDGTKMREMGWTIPIQFWESLDRVVRWTIDHPEWL
jgi:dTDP-glucose 4,6-dehydratase